MKIYVLDANAITRYLNQGPGVENLDRLFVQARRGEARLLISVINRGEALYHLAKRAGKREAIDTLKTLSHYVESVAVTEDHATGATSLKLTYKLGYADCFAADLALRMNATLVTADPEFAKFGKQLKVLFLPRHSA